MGTLASYVPQLQGLVKQGVPGAADARNTLAVLCMRGQAVAKVLEDVERKKADRFSIARQNVLDLAEDIAVFHRSLFYDPAYPSGMFTALRDAERALFSILLYRRGWASARGLTAATADRQYPATDLRSLVPYIVRPGDTIERLALRLLGSVTRSWEVIDLNDLHAPFFDTAEIPCTTGPGIARPGDTIMLPPDALVPQQEISRTAMDVALYGRDIDLSTGYVQMATDELATVEGVPNITQALLQRIATTVGELVLHPEYGLESPLVIGTEGTYPQIAFNGLEIARTVAQDARVTRVHDISSVFKETKDMVSMKVNLIGPGQREIALNIVLPDVVATAP